MKPDNQHLQWMMYGVNSKNTWCSKDEKHRTSLLIFGLVFLFNEFFGDQRIFLDWVSDFRSVAPGCDKYNSRIKFTISGHLARIE